ncbi:MAG: RtcB family protein, partial [Acidobacteria bacterium]|nr:RtcB family protein [Acidobacteriota bacterium]
MELKKIHDYLWEIPKTGGMRVPGRIYASSAMLEVVRTDRSLQQVVNVAHLPGILNYSLAMPDIHWGYGFPIGGVAATDPEEGVISPGGVGYDINCGVRLVRTSLVRSDIQDKLKRVVGALYENVPTGVGASGAIRRLSAAELKKVLAKGGRWAVEQGFGREEDLQHTEENGCLQGADPDVVSSRALERGASQVGTLGSGNHFLELDVVDELFDEQVAQAFGLQQGGVVILIHTGSRGLGHQVCTDYLQVMDRAMKRYRIELPDRQLACVPLQSLEGKDYLAAMQAAANFAWANRQTIMHFA